MVESGQNKRRMVRILMGTLLVLIMMFVCVRPAKAASFKKNAKPKFVITNCKYSGDSATLTWKKIKGAKKYVVYRAKKKNGKYKKFATTKKLTITKKSQGEYYYKVQAVKGKEKSKMSACVHLFAASGNIYNSMTMSTSISLGGFMTRSGGGVRYYYAAVKNLTKKAMTIKEGDSCNFIQLDPKTGETKQLGTGELTEGAVIQSSKDAAFTVKATPQYVDTDTVLVIQVPFTAGGKMYTLNIARDPVNTWISALKK